MTTTAPTKTQEMEDLLIELVAEECAETPRALRERLEANGAAMPIDSLFLLEIAPELRERTGLTLLTSKLTTKATRSIASFAHYIAHEAM
jgi:acyl carrier protein